MQVKEIFNRGHAGVQPNKSAPYYKIYYLFSAGPIRTKHRKDTSPYGSERLSISNATGGSNSHLSPPDTSGAWRRVRSDPFLATSSKTNGGSSTGVSPAGSVTDAPTAVQDSNASPLHGASPTMHRRGTFPKYML